MFLIIFTYKLIINQQKPLVTNYIYHFWEYDHVLTFGDFLRAALFSKKFEKIFFSLLTGLYYLGYIIFLRLTYL